MFLCSYPAGRLVCLLSYVLCSYPAGRPIACSSLPLFLRLFGLLLSLVHLNLCVVSTPGGCRVFPLLVLMGLCFASCWLACSCWSCWLFAASTMQVVGWGFLVSVLALCKFVPLVVFGSLFPFLVFVPGCRFGSAVLILA